jgi:hypothetical protein
VSPPGTCTPEARCAAMHTAIESPVVSLALVSRPGLDVIGIVNYARRMPPARERLLDACPWCGADLRWWGETPPSGCYEYTPRPPSAEGTR